jgi:hypothetical protein
MRYRSVNSNSILTHNADAKSEFQILIKSLAESHLNI